MKVGRWFVRGLGVARLLLAILLLGVGGASLTARWAHAQVSAVVVQGNQRVEADTIRSYFKPGPGGRLDAFQIDEGVKALYATGLFQDVSLTRQGDTLLVRVVENPIVNRPVPALQSGLPHKPFSGIRDNRQPEIHRLSSQDQHM